MLMATPKKKGARRYNAVSGAECGKIRPKWCHRCVKPYSTRSATCPGCRAPFAKKVKEIDTKNKWHAATSSTQIVGNISEVCEQVRNAISLQRGDGVASIWFDKEIMATVKHWSSGRTEINYNEEHRAWKALSEELIQALSASGLATA